jgi:hypothetical protein
VKRSASIITLLCLMVFVWMAGAAPPQQDNDGPAITAFTSERTSVVRATLVDGTALIPVVWSAVNRPLTANLVFEQVLDDDEVVNVELPRDFEWVNSSGQGVVAPVLPGDDATHVQLRLRLVEMDTGVVHDERSLELLIVEAATPAIRYFRATTEGALSAERLAQRIERVPVSWAVDDRPDGSNLVFEQVLADEVVNVELPRPWDWVNSVGEGLVAPVLPAEDDDELILRLRLVSMDDGEVYAEETLTLPVAPGDAPQPAILRFSTTATQVNAGQLAAQTARVPVSWQVVNRPEDSNLVFEQVFHDGSVVNVELPRTWDWVDSTGSGVVAPLPPTGGQDFIRLRLRVVNTLDDSTLASVEFALSVQGTVD